MSEEHKRRSSGEVVEGFRNHLAAELARIAAEQVVDDLYPGVKETLPSSPAEAYLLGRRDEAQERQAKAADESKE